MMFIDASAIVAILAKEPDADALLARLANSSAPQSSPIVRFEVIRALARSRSAAIHGLDVPMSAEFILHIAEVVDGFLREFGIVEREVTPEDGLEAIRASATYGRGTGHPAKLNFGDCFSYACAKSAGVPLLFKGDDFIHTDIERV